MTQFVVVSPGPDNTVASGPQFGVKYTLTGADGIRAVFNDPTDADYVGWLTDISGFDSPEMRENADDLVGDDGGVHGDFYFGRRPVVLSGVVEPRPDNTSRNQRMTRLQRASNAMRRDSTLRWIPEGGIEQEISVRRQQPLRITGGYMKEFQMALVAADPRIYGAEIMESRVAPNIHTTYLNNRGTMRTPPDISVYGPATAIEIHNHFTGKFLVLNTGYTLTAGNRLDISIPKRTVLLNGVTNAYDKVNFASTQWFEIEPGSNQVAWHATGTDANSTMIVRWRDAWA